ncbi:glycosyltransferase family 4 protein [bacterium]|nr:glycosyltransferase family 4 protein [bacterium]
MALSSLTFVISSISSGGAERVLSLIANYWAEMGRKITILTFDDGREPPFFSLHPSIGHRFLGLASASSNPVQGIIRNIKRIFVLRHAIKEISPQLVISFIDQTNILTLIATTGLRLPVIVSERTDPYFHSIGRAWSILRILVYTRARCLVVQSGRALEYFPAFIRRKTMVIPNPVICCPEKSETPTNLRFTKRDENTQRGFSSEKTSEENQKEDESRKGKVIVGIGRLSHEKGFDMLLRAFRRISEFYPDWSLRIFGEGPMRISLGSLRDRLGLSGRVSFPGRTIAPDKELKKADIFVMPSRYEGFPNALCEAMACGLAVVSFDCPGGPKEIIRNGVDGILVLQGDITALAAAIESLINNEKERKRLGQNARREIIGRFGIEKVMPQWEDLLERVFSR